MKFLILWYCQEMEDERGIASAVIYLPQWQRRAYTGCKASLAPKAIAEVSTACSQ